MAGSAPSRSINDLKAGDHLSCIYETDEQHRAVQAEKKDLHILLVEDDGTNQKVALLIFAMLGYTADVAGCGREALQSLEKRSYDIIFMDIQMPEMDGFETTAHIRAMERDTGNHTPIVAMTAHAMPGYRERCLAAGMDNYMAKPIDRAELIEILSFYASGTGAVRSRPEHVNTPPERTKTCDFDVVLHCLGDNRDLHHEVLEVFLYDTPQKMDKLKEALRNKDYHGARRLSHSLKGASSTIGAFAFSSLSLEIEKAAAGNEDALLGALYLELQEEYEVLKGSIADYQKELT